MKEISLKDLLEAGCHFGHRVERWHPKASTFIFQGREGIHIIDLAQTRGGLKNAADFIHSLGVEGKSILLIGTKRQAKGVVSEAAKRAGLPYLTNRWIGGFITNWEEVKKNVDKVNTMRREKTDGSWSKFPKHEQVKLEKDLRKLEMVYDGVADVKGLPDALFVVDIKKEHTCVKEAIRRGIPIIAIVDTNTDPTPVDYAIPANDDAVGSVQYVVNYLADAYSEGKTIGEKQQAKRVADVAKQLMKEENERDKGSEVQRDKEIESVKETKAQSVKEKNEKTKKSDKVKKKKNGKDKRIS